MSEEEVRTLPRVRARMHPDPLDLCMLLLGAAAGITDVIGYTKLGQVLPSAMTGNTALLGLALGQDRLVAASRSIAALLGFVAGGGVASFMLGEERPGPAASIRVLAVEMVALAMFAAIWIATAPAFGGAALYTMIVLAAVGMGMQSALARRIDLPGITTVVFTSTLTAIVGALAGAIRKRDPLLPAAIRRQLSALAVYIAAAIVAGFAVWQGSEIVCALPFAAVAGAYLAQVRRKRTQGRTA
ncbi:MAG: YoaK family protein [Acetobacteraceae bacterium]